MGPTRSCPQCGQRVVGTLDRCPKDGAALFSDEVMARVGMLLKDHELLGVVGEGGMGVVYRAQHVVIEKAVAIKVLHDRFARQKDMVEQFVIEAKAASRIRHPNIIDVTDFGTTPDGLVFLVMEYLDGESLEERLRSVGRLPMFEAVNIATQIARALGAAHELGIVHRDLKPANIFLCQREGRRRIVRRTTGESDAGFSLESEGTFDLVKLLDFGVAKFMDLGPSAATRMGVLCGTPYYLSPEQAQEKPATERSDIYALGAVLYEMVTGQVPFGGASMLEILSGHVSGVVPVASRVAPDAGIDPRLDAVIGRCLEKDPGKRFASADDVAAALRQCVADRAFLRDARHLAGIEASGIDLSTASPGARADCATAGPAEDGGMAGEGLDDDADDGGDALGLRRSRRHRALGLAAVAALVLAGVGGAIWGRGSGGGAAEGRPVSATAKVKPEVPPSPRATVPAGAPSASAGVEATDAAKLAPAARPDPVLAQVKASGVAKRPASAPGGPDRKPAAEPAPRGPVPPSVAASVAAASAEPAQPVDVEALLQDAQQASRRRYFALAIDKARAALKADPGRQIAYEIIATSSCELGEVAEARQAVRRLDDAKRKQVLALCERNGVKLD